MIDLRSDTLSKPPAEMLAAMAAAEVGDEQYREDPTTNELQHRMAELLGHEAALFVPTATMANQIALRAQTTPGSTLVAEERTHTIVFEMGGPAIHSGLMVRALRGEAGRLSPEQIEGGPDLGRGGAARGPRPDLPGAVRRLVRERVFEAVEVHGFTGGCAGGRPS